MVLVPIGVAAALLALFVHECLCQTPLTFTDQCAEDACAWDASSLLQTVQGRSRSARSVDSSGGRARIAMQMWTDFKATFGKIYDSGDENDRFKIFKSNLAFIETENAKNLSYKLGVTPFADLTVDEFASAHLAYKKLDKSHGNSLSLGEHTDTGEPLVDKPVDWRSKGAVTPVKDNGQCTSSWAFSTTGALEGRWAIATKNLKSLSEQQFVDCDGVVNAGCNGGLMTAGFLFAKSTHLCTENSYPYTAQKGTCRSRSSSCNTAIPKGSVTGYKTVPPSAHALMSGLQNGPVSAAIDSGGSFRLYKGGVFGECGTALDHGVLVVGYDAEAWIVKNSWGASWGDHGYVRIDRVATNVCGILEALSYPVVSADQ